MILLALTVIVAIFLHTPKLKPFMKRLGARPKTGTIWIGTGMVLPVKLSDKSKPGW